MTATALDQCIGFSNTDDYDTTPPTKPAPVFRYSTQPSQLVRFVDDIVRRSAVLPDLATLRSQAVEWLAGDEPDLPAEAADLKAKTLAAYGHSFAKTYEGFTHGAPF
ncbi:hypothetical protein [Burkholderia glumae]|uniref:hypothetical protein n=1 Tax=Burkholderia glumae TaxID=337 RepID=UPI0002E8696D|nr:hypothetical protein [Burkholderia glumae]PJO21645.1 hypothetical protein Y5A_018270 [Burkholderia glumae AU6208]QHE10589.1 hypothetical protein GQR88_09390 [Burkholderia glumae AU6208]